MRVQCKGKPYDVLDDTKHLEHMALERQGAVGAGGEMREGVSAMSNSRSALHYVHSLCQPEALLPSGGKIWRRKQAFN